MELARCRKMTARLFVEFGNVLSFSYIRGFYDVELEDGFIPVLAEARARCELNYFADLRLASDPDEFLELQGFPAENFLIRRGRAAWGGDLDFFDSAVASGEFWLSADGRVLIHVDGDEFRPPNCCEATFDDEPGEL